MKQCTVSFKEVVSMENLCEAWREFILGKRNKKDVQEFALHLGDGLSDLHADLTSGVYPHGGYQHFRINDPKPRDIHKATVRDRLLQPRHPPQTMPVLRPAFNIGFIFVPNGQRSASDVGSL